MSPRRTTTPGHAGRASIIGAISAAGVVLAPGGVMTAQAAGGSPAGAAPAPAASG